MKKKPIIILASVLILFCIIVISGFSKMYREVKEITLTAVNEYELTAVESLIKIIESEDHGFEEKNAAIYALGQFADKDALPFLEELNAQTEDNSPCYWFEFNEEICKYEVEKAVKWCKQGNRSSWMYKKLRSYGLEPGQ